MTMAQFADQLPQQVNGYVDSAVLDKTGLTDAYDFTLSFSGIGILQNSLQGPGQLVARRIRMAHFRFPTPSVSNWD
jgi:uncharacterized protein (TIGR03435 family)